MPRDPLTKRAEEVANNALNHRVGSRFYAKVKGPELYIRDEISQLASPRTRKDFIQTIRVAMLNHMEDHRNTCKLDPCKREDLYEELKFILLDELDVLTPEGAYTEDLSSAQIARMEQIKTEILEAVRAAHADAIEADLVLLGAVEEGIEELMKDRSTKTTNTGSMIRRYVEKLTERLAGKLIVDPMIDDIINTLN